MTPDLPASPILDEYLAELERAAADLPVAQRAELLADIRAHVAEACAEADDPAGAIPTILAQLGDPAEIVEAARADLPPAEAPAAGRASDGPGVVEAIALVLLVLSGLAFWLFLPLPWIGWLAGLALLCTSRQWTLRDKLIGFAGAGLAPIALSAMVFAVAGASSCTESASDSSVTVHGTVTAAPVQTTVECTQGGTIPPALAIAVALLLIAALALALRHLSTTRGRTGLPVG